MASQTQGTTTIATHLADHPRLVGALFVFLLVITQAQAVGANPGTTYNGP